MLARATSVATSLAALFFAGGCGDSHLYYSEAQGYISALSQEMAHAGLKAEGRVYFEAGGWRVGSIKGGGVRVHAYEVTDPTLANRLVERVRETHAMHPEVPVTVTVYSNPHTAILSGSEVVIAHVEVR